MTAEKNRSKKPAGRRGKPGAKPGCGLCGKKAKLTKTECCDQWICDDEEKYVLFSYARNSCYRNHDLYTLCSYHHREGHPGSWKACQPCRRSFETEMYVYYGINEYNFETLENRPAYEPTRCSRCGAVIVLSRDGYSIKEGQYRCEECTDKEMRKRVL